MIKPNFNPTTQKQTVSVIIPFNNRKKILPRAVKSIINQTVLPTEILLCDDGSTDHPEEIECTKPISIRWIKDPICYGVSHARNRGIVEAKGDLYAFLDSDDTWMPNKLELQLKFLEEHPQFRIVHGDEIWIRNDIRINPQAKFLKSGGDIFSRSVKFSLIAPSAVLARKEIFQDYGTFDESLPVCEDYDLWLRIMSAGEEFGFISKPLVTRYAGHQGQLSMRYEAMDRFRAASLFKILQMPQISQEKEAILRQALQQKAAFLLHGAEKRGHMEDVALFQSYLAT